MLKTVCCSISKFKHFYKFWLESIEENIHLNYIFASCSIICTWACFLETRPRELYEKIPANSTCYKVGLLSMYYVFYFSLSRILESKKQPMHYVIPNFTCLFKYVFSYFFAPVRTYSYNRTFRSGQRLGCDWAFR